MRSFSVLAVLSAVLSAGAANACCFFKCFGRSTPMATAGPETAKGMRPASYGDPITIVSIGGKPVSSTPVDDVDISGTVEIVVEEDPSYLFSNEQLLLTDLGPRGPGPAATTRKKGDHPKARLKSKKLKWRQVQGQATRAGDPLAVQFYWEVTFEVAGGDLTPGEKYSVYATATSGWDNNDYKSSTVYFTTKSP